jgi:hypothetical protein
MIDKMDEGWIFNGDRNLPASRDDTITTFFDECEPIASNFPPIQRSPSP